MTKLKMDLVCQVAVVVNSLEEGLTAFREIFGFDEDSLSSPIPGTPMLRDG